ncbi:hypothetical protein EON77_08500 [bacterium]|nr:MAG: hypothetical protein EON77_08500 [bacterium]
MAVAILISTFAAFGCGDGSDAGSRVERDGAQRGALTGGSAGTSSGGTSTGADEAETETEVVRIHCGGVSTGGRDDRGRVLLCDPNVPPSTRTGSGGSSTGGSGGAAPVYTHAFVDCGGAGTGGGDGGNGTFSCIPYGTDGGTTIGGGTGR